MPGRGTTGQRGYGLKHKAQRAKWVKRVDAGLVDCARCGKPIEPGRPWDMGHTEDRTGWTGPECVPCNRRAGGKKGAAVTNAMRRKGVQVSRVW